MRKGFAPLIILVIIALLAVGGFFYFKSLPSLIPSPENKIIAQEYEKVGISQLIADPKAWDGKKVAVSGFYNGRSLPIPLCMFVEKKPNPELKNEYKRYNTIWAISDGEGDIGVIVEDGDIQISNRPNYGKDQQITIKAVARYTEVEQDCNPNILYKSVYLEVQAKDLGDALPSKPLPSNAPSNK